MNEISYPLTKSIGKSMHFLNLKKLTNQHIHERALATGLIQDGEAVEDVATRLSTYEPKLGEFL